MKVRNKALLVVALLLCVSHSAMAQKDATGKRIIGIRGGFTFSPAFPEEGVDRSVYPTGGVSASFPITKLPFYIETGLYYANRYASDKDYPGSYQDNSSFLLPALLSYHIRLSEKASIQPFTGLFLAYGIDQGKLEEGWRMGIGFNYKKFYINGGYDFSFKPGTYESALFAMIGYNF